MERWSSQVNSLIKNYFCPISRYVRIIIYCFIEFWHIFFQSRRAIAVRRIDERLGKAKEGHFYEQKLALLANEDEIEADFERQVYKVAIIIMHMLIANFLNRQKLQ